MDEWPASDQTSLKAEAGGSSGIRPAEVKSFPHLSGGRLFDLITSCSDLPMCSSPSAAVKRVAACWSPALDRKSLIRMAVMPCPEENSSAAAAAVRIGSDSSDQIPIKAIVFPQDVLLQVHQQLVRQPLKSPGRGADAGDVEEIGLSTVPKQKVLRGK